MNFKQFHIVMVLLIFFMSSSINLLSKDSFIKILLEDEINEPKKPVYLYLISGGFFLLASSLEAESIFLYYLFIVIGIGILIWTIVKYLRN